MGQANGGTNLTMNHQPNCGYRTGTPSSPLQLTSRGPDVPA